LFREQTLSTGLEVVYIVDLVSIPFRAVQVGHQITKPINLPQPFELNLHCLLPPFAAEFIIFWNGLSYETVPSDGAIYVNAGFVLF
jgi:hypothetical protein